MSNHPHHDELDRLLRDEGVVERADLAGVLREIRDRLEEPPVPATAERHLAAITAAATAAAHEAARRAPAPAAVGAPRPWGLRLRRALGLTAVKVAVGVGAAAAATGGGLAATGNLPDPAQQVVADVAERIGINLPQPDPAAPVTPADGDTGADRPVDRTTPGRPPDGAGSGRGESARPTEVPGRRPSEPGRPHQGNSDLGNAPTVTPGDAGDRGSSRNSAPGKADAPDNAPSDPAASSAARDEGRSSVAADHSSHALAVPRTTTSGTSK